MKASELERAVSTGFNIPSADPLESTEPVKAKPRVHDHSSSSCQSCEG